MKEQLLAIKKVVEDLEYECTLVEKGDLTPIDTLLVALDEDDESSFAINVLPLSEDLDGSHFVQFYYEYPVAIPGENHGAVSTKIHEINRELPLGYFNFTISNIQVYYKYVFAMPMNAKVSAANFADIIDMVVFSVTHYESQLIK